jgi:hypothetical protein
VLGSAPDKLITPIFVLLKLKTLAVTGVNELAVLLNVTPVNFCKNVLELVALAVSEAFPLAVAAADKVITLVLTTDAMVVLAGIPTILAVIV